MAKFISRITVVSVDPGHKESKVVYKDKKKKRKVSRWLAPMERWHRRSLESQKTYYQELLTRHNSSNRKRRNGFLRDGLLNLTRAQRKAMKRLRKFL